MKRRWIIGALLICIGASLYLRIALPYDCVFTSEWIKFTSVDAYWQMINVDRIAIDFPAYASQILNMSFFHWLLSAVIWCIGLGSPTQHTIDTVAVYFPAALAALTVIPVYFIGKVLFGRMAGLLAAALIAILPGEWLGRSILGFTDHHVAEVLFSTTAMMFFLIALKADGRRRVIYSLLTGLFIGIYLLTWAWGVLFVFIIATYLCAQVFLNLLHHRNTAYPIVLLASGAITAIVVYALTPGIFGNMMPLLNIPSWPTAFTTTTMELRPLLYPEGTFTLVVAWATFGFILLLVPVAIVALIYHAVRTGNPGVVLLVIWSLVTLILMLGYRRFGYYFAVNAALLSGWFAWYVWYRLSKKSIAYAVMVTAILLTMMIIPNTRQAVATASRVPFAPSDAWCSTLSWVEDNTPEDSKILAWWDYGYWINRESHRTAYVTPSQNPQSVANTARMFLSQSDESVETDYIILDYTTTTGKLWAVATWAGLQPSDFSDIYYVVRDGKSIPVQLFYPEYYQSLSVQLYNFDGKAVIPTQSTVVSVSFGGKILTSIDVYATYEEAIAHKSFNSRIVGTSPFISPVPLKQISQYELVYSSVEKIEGVPEVKVFRVVKEGETDEN